MSADWAPDQYEKFKDERSKPFWDLVDLLPDDARVSSILDLGCGTGELTAKLQKKLEAQFVLGIDSSAAMLARAQKFQTDSLVFEQAAMESFKPSQKFDLIFSNAAMHWVPQHRQFLKMMTSWLSPHGQIAVQMPANFDHPSHRIAREVAQEFKVFQPDDDASNNILSLRDYADLLWSLGFKRQICREQLYPHSMTKVEDVVEWVKGSTLTPFEKRLSAEQFSQFVDEYRQRLVAELGQQTPYLYTFRRIFMWASF